MKRTVKYFIEDYGETGAEFVNHTCNWPIPRAERMMTAQEWLEKRGWPNPWFNKVGPRDERLTLLMDEFVREALREGEAEHAKEIDTRQQLFWATVDKVKAAEAEVRELEAQWFERVQERDKAQREVRELREALRRWPAEYDSENRMVMRFTREEWARLLAGGRTT